MSKVQNRRDAIEKLRLIEAVLPAAREASKLRACGLRLVGDEATIEALKQMAADGNADAELVLCNLFPHGHAEIS